MKNYLKLTCLYVLLRGGLSCSHSPVVPPIDTPKRTDTLVLKPVLSYQNGIKPVFDLYCNSCHGAVIASKGIRFDEYFTTKIFVGDDTTRFFCVINHHNNCLPMPLNLPKIPDSVILKLETWVRAGLREK